MPRITKRFVDALKPTARDVVFWDEDLTGFGVRVRPSGARSYVYVYRAGGGRRGRLRNMTLAPVGKITPEEARRAAQRASAAVAHGGDPAGEKQAVRADMAVAELVHLYLKEGPADKPAKKASSWATDFSNLHRHVVPLLGRRRASTLAKSDIQRFQRDVSDGKTKAPPTATGAKKRGRIRVTGGPGTAWRATVVLAAMLKWAKGRGLLKNNPAEGVQLNKPQIREPFLNDAELARLGAAVAELEEQGANAASLTIARLLALTGARKSEVAGGRWSDVDFQRGTLAVPDGKTGFRVIPLGAPALTVLSAWADRPGTDRAGYVFPAERGNGHHVGHSKVWRRLREKAGLSDVRLHDLRHTHASAGIALNQSLFLVGKVLGHRKARTTEKYAHLELDPVRAAADQTARRVETAMQGNEGKLNVVPLAKR